MLCRQGAFCYSRTRATDALFRGSSVVEQPAVNRLVVGSNPTRGAISPAKSLSPIMKARWTADDDRGLDLTSVENMPTRGAAPKSYHRIPAGSAQANTRRQRAASRVTE
jgi:hypothetical protein